ncbi:fimbrial protein [Superficieibacter electus]|uniref:Fimbrial protein n=1 Tax=Superficieibacter electus TaxID=2022662 RepID=A0A2P5GJB5_9ENTR|nr:fimbrial protein BcfF [Superficieibacter electus]POP41351.1 fimbrial protein [Superficieibacter electus]POP43751.1 fimbrial protein [Superficieibacter electus]
MKYLLLLILVICFGVQAHDGRVYITGTITDNTCTLTPDSENITVNMGSVSNRQFYQAGAGAAYQPFSINLENCGSTASGVTVSFSGTEDPKNPDLLAIAAGAGNASGVGIALYNSDKSLIPAGENSRMQPLIGGQSSVHLTFYARYVADGNAVVAGEADASATFVLTYA